MPNELVFCSISRGAIGYTMTTEDGFFDDSEVALYYLYCSSGLADIEQCNYQWKDECSSCSCDYNSYLSLTCST